jgi:hypothetical protein
MDFRDTPVMAVALLANAGHDIKTKFMLGGGRELGDQYPGGHPGHPRRF